MDELPNGPVAHALAGGQDFALCGDPINRASKIRLILLGVGLRGGGGGLLAQGAKSCLSTIYSVQLECPGGGGGGTPV